jgi:hypothetical protein
MALGTIRARAAHVAEIRYRHHEHHHHQQQLQNEGKHYSSATGAERWQYKQTNIQTCKVWLRQGSKVETTKHTGIKTPFPIHRTKKTRYSNYI